MKSSAVDLLECYLRDHPDLRRSILLDPPRLRWRGRWRRITRCQFRFSGLRLTLVNGETAFLSIQDAQSHRQDQLRSLLNLIGRGFRGWKVERILDGTDRVRHQSGAILRVLLRRGRRRQLLLVAYPDSGPSPDRMLSSALLWWDAARATLKPEGLLVCIPENWSQELVRSLPTLTVSVQCFEYRRATGSTARRWLPPPRDWSGSSPVRLQFQRFALPVSSSPSFQTFPTFFASYRISSRHWT